MLAYIEIVNMYFKKFRILFQGKERPAEKKYVPAKLRTVLANFGISRWVRSMKKNAKNLVTLPL